MGWSSAWLSDSVSFTDFYVGAAGLSVPGAAGAGGKATFAYTGKQLNDALRYLPLQSTGVVFVQFLSQFGAQSGGGTPTIRLSSLAGVTGGVGNNGACGSPVYAILDASLQPIASSCSTTPLAALRAVVLRIDYAANHTRMWVMPSLTGFDYLNPPAPSAEYLGLAPAFDRIAFYSRNPASIDELRVFRVSAGPTTAPWAVPANSAGALFAVSALMLVLAGAVSSRRSRL